MLIDENCLGTYLLCVVTLAVCDGVRALWSFLTYLTVMRGVLFGVVLDVLLLQVLALISLVVIMAVQVLVGNLKWSLSACVLSYWRVSLVMWIWSVCWVVLMFVVLRLCVSGVSVGLVVTFVLSVMMPLAMWGLLWFYSGLAGRMVSVLTCVVSMLLIGLGLKTEFELLTRNMLLLRL